MHDNARGGDDTLIGAAIGLTTANNVLYGDAHAMYGNTRGGNDTLIGGAGTGGRYQHVPLWRRLSRCTTTPKKSTLAGGDEIRSTNLYRRRQRHGWRQLAAATTHWSGGEWVRKTISCSAMPPHWVYAHAHGGDDTLTGGDDGREQPLYGDAAP